MYGLQRELELPTGHGEAALAIGNWSRRETCGEKRQNCRPPLVKRIQQEGTERARPRLCRTFWWHPTSTVEGSSMSSQQKRFVTSSSNRHLEHGLGLWRAVNDPNSIEVRSMPSRVRRWCNRQNRSEMWVVAWLGLSRCWFSGKSSTTAVVLQKCLYIFFGGQLEV